MGNRHSGKENGNFIIRLDLPKSNQFQNEKPVHIKKTTVTPLSYPLKLHNLIHYQVDQGFSNILLHACHSHYVAKMMTCNTMLLTIGEVP